MNFMKKDRERVALKFRVKIKIHQDKSFSILFHKVHLRISKLILLHKVHQSEYIFFVKYFKTTLSSFIKKMTLDFEN